MKKHLMKLIFAFTMIVMIFAVSATATQASSDVENLFIPSDWSVNDDEINHSGFVDWFEPGQTYTMSIPDLVGENSTPQFDYYLPDNSNIVGSFSETTRPNGDPVLSFTFTVPNIPDTRGYLSVSNMNESNLAQWTHFYGFEGFQIETGSSVSNYAEPDVDDTPPVIYGDSVYFTSVDDPATVEEVQSTLTAEDETDGEVTDDIVVAEDNYTGNEGTLGEYDIVFEVSDSWGNTAQTTVEVRVVDITPPEIELQGSSTIYLEVFDTWNDPGAIVTDNYDDDLSYSTSGSVDTSSLGEYTIEYDAVDNSGNAAETVTRTVIVQDTTPPEIDLNGDSTIYIEYGDSYDELGAIATDNYDSDVEVTISGSVDIDNLGEYTIEYNAVDSSGNAAETVTRTVIVQNTTPPVFNLEDPVTYNSENNFVNELISGITAGDSYDGDLTDSIEIIESEFDGNENTVGEYEVTLRVTNSEGNSTTETITITVLDNIPPVFHRSSDLLTPEEADNMTQKEIRDHILGR